ncbi:MAG: hypothetical protein ACXVQU_10450 [Actinomycetota bacterium]
MDRRRRAVETLAAFGAYLAVSFALFGIPVVSRFRTRFAGAGRGDARFYAWDLAWWPHTLTAGLDPFHARVVWFPGGIDLAWVTGIPGPSLATWPITRTLGSIASDNVLTILAPALAGLGAYLLGRRLSDRFWPAFAGGYLFAFGTYEIAQMRGHVNLFLMFPVPFAAYLFVRAVDGSLGERAYTLLMALVLVAEFSISMEIFATMTVFGAIAVAGVWLFGPRDRHPVLLRALGGTAIAYALALVVLAPYLYNLVVAGPVVGHRLENASVDLLSFVLPRPGTLIGGRSLARVTRHFVSNTSEDGAYLSAPVLAIVALSAIRARRDRVSRLLLVFAGIAAVAALGPELHVDGRPVLPLPWAIAAHLPLLRFALPQRFTLYLWLAMAMLAVRWLSETPTEDWRRYATVGLAAVLLLPNVASPDLHRPQAVPAFFRAPADAARLAPPGHSLLILHPVKGQDMLWQAETDFVFAMAQGHMGSEPAPFRGDQIWAAIRDNRPFTIGPEAFLRFLGDHRVSAVVVSPGADPGWRSLLAASGMVGNRVDGVRVYRRRPCGPRPAPGHMRRKPGSHCVPAGAVANRAGRGRS